VKKFRVKKWEGFLSSLRVLIITIGLKKTGAALAGQE